MEEVAGLVTMAFGVLIVPLLCTSLTRSAAQGHLDRNGVAGIRTRATMASDAAWQAGHEAALPLVERLWGVAVATLAVGVVAVVALEPGAGVVAGLVGLGAELTVLLLAARRANEAAGAQK